MDVLEYIKKMQEMYGDDVITTADKINRPDPKPIVKEIEAINEFVKRNPRAGGGRIGFYKGSFVEGNPVGQQWVVKFASKSTSPGYPDNFIGTQKFETEELMNKAIEDRKLISKKNVEIRDKKNVEMGKAKKAEYKNIIDDFIEKGDYENFKTQHYKSQMKKKVGSGNLRQTKGGRVPTYIVKFIRDRLDAGPGTELFEELKKITGKTDTELLEFNKNLAPRGDIPVKKRSKSATESFPDKLKLTEEEKKEGQRKRSETRKTKEKVGTKYASELELKNAFKIEKEISNFNTMFKNDPDLINTPQFAKLKEMMEIQIAGTDRTLPSGKKVKAGELFRREVDSKGNLITDEYYRTKAKQGKIMSFFDINKVGTQMGKYATNINIAPGLFNSAFIEGQVERYFKKGGKFHGDTEKLKVVDDYLKSVGVKVKITDVGRIGGGDPVFFDSKTKTFPHISNTLRIMGFKDNMLTSINPRAGERGLLSRELAEGLARGAGKGIRIAGKYFGIPDAIFYYIDKQNMLSKGIPEAEAQEQALKNATFGLYKRNNEYMKGLKKTAESMGIDARAFDDIYKVNVAGQTFDKYYVKAKEEIENLKELGYAKRADDAQKNLDRYMKEQNEKLDNLSQKVIDQVSISKAGGAASPLQLSKARDVITEEDFYKPFKDITKAATEKLTREKRSVFSDIERKVDPAEGKWSTRVFDTLDFLGQGFKNIALGSTNPTLMDLSERQKKAKYLREANLSDLNLINKARGLTYDQPITDADIMNLRYNQPGVFFSTGGRASHMGGGIASIRRPNAIPPERQGLRSIMINVNDD